MVSPESALISLRKMVRPAPPDVPDRDLSTCCWTDDDASMTVDAWPNPSEAPKPVMGWNVVAPLIVAVSGASAGVAPPTRAATTTTPPTASGRIFETFGITGRDRALPGMTASLVGIAAVTVNPGPETDNS